MSKTNGKKEVIGKIKNWLEEESYEFSIVEQAYADFQADLRHPNMSVVFLRNKKDSIHFETYVGFTEDDKKIFASAVKKENKANFISNVQLYLLIMNVEYSFQPNIENLEKIYVMRNIFFDGLSKDKFIDTIFALVRASSMINILMSSHLGIRRSNSNGKLTT